jgi:hypothetical protein
MVVNGVELLDQEEFTRINGCQRDSRTSATTPPVPRHKVKLINSGQRRPGQHQLFDAFAPRRRCF